MNNITYEKTGGIMEAFYVCMIFLGSILVLVSLFFSIMDKVNGKDFFTEFDRKKDEMFTLIADAEEMIQELNKMSDYVIGTISDKSQELIQLHNSEARIKGNTYDVSKTDKSNVINENKSDVINTNKSNVINANKSDVINSNKSNVINANKSNATNANKPNITDDSNVTVKSNVTNKSNVTDKSDVAKADKYIVSEAKKSNVKEVHAAKSSKVDAANKVNSEKKASQNSSNIMVTAKEENVNEIDTDSKVDSIEAVEDTIEISKQELSKLQSVSVSLHDGTQAQQINTYQQSPVQLNEYQHKVLISEQKHEDNKTAQHTAPSYNKTSSRSIDNISSLGVNEKRREALILIQKGLSNTEISGLLKIGKGEVALLRGLNK